VHGGEVLAVEEALDLPVRGLRGVDVAVAHVARVARRHPGLVGSERVRVAVRAVELLAPDVPLVAEREPLLAGPEQDAAREGESRERERSRGPCSPA
jgi:hypothetical protein